MKKSYYGLEEKVLLTWATACTGCFVRQSIFPESSPKWSNLCRWASLQPVLKILWLVLSVGSDPYKKLL